MSEYPHVSIQFRVFPFDSNTDKVNIKTKTSNVTGFYTHETWIILENQIRTVVTLCGESPLKLNVRADDTKLRLPCKE
jgi:hypothetical protein